MITQTYRGAEAAGTTAPVKPVTVPGTRPGENDIKPFKRPNQVPQQPTPTPVPKPTPTPTPTPAPKPKPSPPPNKPPFDPKKPKNPRPWKDPDKTPHPSKPAEKPAHPGRKKPETNPPPWKQPQKKPGWQPKPGKPEVPPPTKIPRPAKPPTTTPVKVPRPSKVPLPGKVPVPKKIPFPKKIPLPIPRVDPSIVIEIVLDPTQTVDDSWYGLPYEVRKKIVKRRYSDHVKRLRSTPPPDRKHKQVKYHEALPWVWADCIVRLDIFGWSPDQTVQSNYFGHPPNWVNLASAGDPALNPVAHQPGAYESDPNWTNYAELPELTFWQVIHTKEWDSDIQGFKVVPIQSLINHAVLIITTYIAAGYDVWVNPNYLECLTGGQPFNPNDPIKGSFQPPPQNSEPPPPPPDEDDNDMPCRYTDQYDKQILEFTRFKDDLKCELDLMKSNQKGLTGLLQKILRCLNTGTPLPELYHLKQLEGQVPQICVTYAYKEDDGKLSRNRYVLHIPHGSSTKTDWVSENGTCTLGTRKSGDRCLRYRMKDNSVITMSGETESAIKSYFDTFKSKINATYLDNNGSNFWDSPRARFTAIKHKNAKTLIPVRVDYYNGTANDSPPFWSLKCKVE